MPSQNAATHSSGTGQKTPGQKTHHGGQQQRTWIKNHQLEGDGIITGFYNFLYKRNGKMKPCEGVLIPDTIVYDHNFPRGWYTSDLKNKEITKRQGKELDADSITRGFSKPPNPSLNVVASYMCSYEEDDKVTGETQTVTSVEFFNEDTLKEFVGRKTKREGILQRFLAPKGLRNSVIQAVWSPRVCIVQRRTNCGSIKDKLQCERDPYPVAVTYEGPTHFSEQGECAPHTSEKVERVCNNILHHFLAIERKYITRIVLYFKVDERDQLWLLFCGSLRVSDRDAPSMMPLNLAPKFTSPSLENGGVSGTSEKEEEALYDADTRHYEMTNDRLFYAQFVRTSPRTLLNSTQGGQNHGAHEGPNPAAGRRDEMLRKEQAAKARAEAKKKAREEASETGAQWFQAPAIQEQYNELVLEREMVLSHFDDVFYEAYGHFLRHEPGNFEFEVDRRVATVLGVDVLQELMQACKIDHAMPSEDAPEGALESEELCFAIPQSAHRTPTKQQGDNIATWVRAHYDRRLQELKEEAISNSDHRAVIQQHSTNHQQQQNTSESSSGLTKQHPPPDRSAVETFDDIKRNYLLNSPDLLTLSRDFASDVPAADAEAGRSARQQMFSSLSKYRSDNNERQSGLLVEDFVKGLRMEYGFSKLDQHFQTTPMYSNEGESDFLLHVVASVLSIAKARTTSFLASSGHQDDDNYSSVIREEEDLLHVLHGVIVSLDVWAAMYDQAKGQLLSIGCTDDFSTKVINPLQQHVTRHVHGGEPVGHLQVERDVATQYEKLCTNHSTNSLLFDPHLSTWVVNTCLAHYMSTRETDGDNKQEAAGEQAGGETKVDEEWMED